MFSDMILSGESSHRIFLLDTETTGLIENGEYPAVIQIAVLDGQSEQSVNSFVSIGSFIMETQHLAPKIGLIIFLYFQFRIYIIFLDI
jgi:hypothetical protein